jgi:hypothetical protein
MSCYLQPWGATAWHAGQSDTHCHQTHDHIQLWSCPIHTCTAESARCPAGYSCQGRTQPLMPTRNMPHMLACAPIPHRSTPPDPPDRQSQHLPMPARSALLTLACAPALQGSPPPGPSTSQRPPAPPPCMARLPCKAAPPQVLTPCCATLPSVDVSHSAAPPGCSLTA